MAKQILKPEGWKWVEEYGFAPAIKSGNTIYTMGMVAFDPDGNVVGRDALTQSRLIFSNLREVLALGGATLNDVVKITTHLSNLRDFEQYKEARIEAFPNGIPASTGVGSGLLLSELLVETEVIAVVD